MAKVNPDIDIFMRELDAIVDEYENDFHVNIRDLRNALVDYVEVLDELRL
jgi:hypothetical protein